MCSPEAKEEIGNSSRPKARGYRTRIHLYLGMGMGTVIADNGSAMTAAILTMLVGTRSVLLTFKTARKLAVTIAAPTGSGAVTIEPAGIECKIGTCTESFADRRTQ